MASLELSPFQRRILTVSLACLGMTIIAIFCFGVFLLLRNVLAAFAHVIWPLAVAGVAALLTIVSPHEAHSGMSSAPAGLAPPADHLRAVSR